MKLHRGFTNLAAILNDIYGVGPLVASREAVSWAVELHRSCQAQDVPFFWKQWGTYENNPLAWAHGGNQVDTAAAKRLDPGGKGGSLLEGLHYREMPECRSGQAPQGWA